MTSYNGLRKAASQTERSPEVERDVGGYGHSRLCTGETATTQGLQSPFPDKRRLPRGNAHDGPYLGRATVVSSSSRTQRV